MKVPQSTDFLLRPADAATSYQISRVGKVVKAKSISAHEVYAKNIAGENAARAAIASYGSLTQSQRVAWDDFAERIPWRGLGTTVTTRVAQTGGGLLLALTSMSREPAGNATTFPGAIWRKRGVEIFLAYNVASQLAFQGEILDPPPIQA